MKTKNFLKHLLMSVLMLTTVKMVGQSSTPGHVASSPTDFLGWDTTSPANDFPLMVKHEGNQPIDWYTDAIQRMRLNKTVSTLVSPVFGFGGITWKTGFLGLSGRPGFFTASPGPFSRLHLVDDVGADDPNVYAQIFGYRPWMRNGITFTGNSDQSYIGHKYVGDDNTDFVIQWSDNPEGSPWGVDRMKFVFSSTYDGASRGMSSMDGMEAIRMWPSSPLTVNVGIGDFAPAGVGDPTERLDVLDGRVRIRQLPTELEADTLTHYVVVDPNGVLGWRFLPNPVPGGGADCDWSIAGTNANVRTAFGVGGGGCPGDLSHVSIGTTNIPGKLTVLENGTVETGEIALHVTMNGNTGNNTGMFLRVNDLNGGSATNNGLDLEASNGSEILRGVLLRTILDAGRTATGDVFGADMVTNMSGTCDETLASHARVNLGASSFCDNAFGAYGLVSNGAATGGTPVTFSTCTAPMDACWVYLIKHGMGSSAKRPTPRAVGQGTLPARSTPRTVTSQVMPS